MEKYYEEQQNIQPKKARKKAGPIGVIKGWFAHAKEGKFDLIFFALVIVLVTVGLVMMFSASFVSALYDENTGYDSFFYIKRQGLFALVGIAAMIIMSRMDYNVVRKLTVPITGVTILLLILVLFSKPVEGVYRWINLGGFITIQPSEIAKFTLIILLAHFITLNPYKMKKFKFIMFLGVIVLVFALFLILEKHLSATIMMLAIGLCMMYAGGLWYNKKGVGLFILIALAVAIAVLIFLVYKFPNLISHAYIRVYAWWHKDFEPLGARWQTNNSLYAIGSGGLLGSGIGQSMQKYLYVSEPQNDFIFAIVCEELGFVGASLILLVYCLLIGRGVQIAMGAKSMYASLLTVGIIFQIGMQVVLNVAVVTDSIPNTGISLPFFSYGGTSIMMLLFEMGVVLSVSRTSRIEKVIK